MAMRSTLQPGTGVPTAESKTGAFQLYLLLVMPIILTSSYENAKTQKHIA